VDDEPVGYRHFCIGDTDLRRSIGMKSTGSESTMMQEGNIVKTFQQVHTALFQPRRVPLMPLTFFLPNVCRASSKATWSGAT
jgi:hypothetical protein